MLLLIVYRDDGRGVASRSECRVHVCIYTDRAIASWV